MAAHSDVDPEGIVKQFFVRRGQSTDAGAKLAEMMDSLAYVDLFIFLDQVFGSYIKASDVAKCIDVGDLVNYVRSVAGPPVRS